MCYPPKSATARILASVAEGYWLVNVIHHEFPEPGKLWEVLGSV